VTVAFQRIFLKEEFASNSEKGAYETLAGKHTPGYFGAILSQIAEIEILIGLPDFGVAVK
jgi:hypothetical protein